MNTEPMRTKPEGKKQSPTKWIVAAIAVVLVVIAGIAIVGGGPVGLSLAAMLAAQGIDPKKIALLDAKPLALAAAESGGGYYSHLRSESRQLPAAVDELIDIARATHSFLNEFDHALVSGDVGLVKPDYRIYHRFCRDVGLAPGELIFVDDSPVNIAAAQAVGYHTFHMPHADAAECAAFRKRLQELGFGV